MSLKCTVTKVVLIKQLPIFIMAQMNVKTQSQQYTQNIQINKFRTQLSLNTARPKFNQNQFIFSLTQKIKKLKLNGNQVFSLKFGLMQLPHDSYGKVLNQDYQKAIPIAITSLNLSLQRLKQIGSKPMRKYFDMVDSRGKMHAQFELVLQYFDNMQYKLFQQSDKKASSSNISNQKQSHLNSQQQAGLMTEQTILFNPLINWMMYDQNCKDPLRQKNCIKALQQQSNNLYKKFNELKNEQSNFQSLLNQLEEDQKQLLTELEMYEKLNNKIAEKLNQKESLQSLKLQIDMLKTSREGKQLLLEKVEYFQDRIYKQEEIHQQLVLRYQKMRPQIQRKLKQSENISHKLKGKQQQQFQIKNNELILNNYQDTLYRYKSQQQVIKSLIKLSKSNKVTEYTKQQAQLFLSQVRYQIKLEEMNIDTRNSYNTNKNEDYQGKLLTMISDEMKHTKIAEQSNKSGRDKENIESEDFVMRIKLDSLQEEIQKIKNKISRLKQKKQPFNQFNNQQSLIEPFNNKSLMSTQ